MRGFLIVLGLLLLALLAVPTAMLLTGTIDTSSLRMLLNVNFGANGPQANAGVVQQRYQVPEGFSVQLFASDIPRARFMRVTSAGDLLVSRPHSGDIQLLRRDADNDGRHDGQTTLIDGLSRPLGMALHSNWLYIAESNRIGRIAFNSAAGTTEGPYQPIIEGLTDNGNHWSKTIGVGPDNRLYLAQGSTCNICAEDDPRRGTMMRFQLDGSAPEIIATGLRNSVGFDWAPFNGELYATDNGRDLLGDNFPPCELNRIRVDAFYGWPYYNGNNVPDPDMGTDPQAGQRQPVAPAHAFKAHNAPLGMTFLHAANLPSDYQHSALVALHGSWNRSSPDGYKVVSLHFGDHGIEERDFLWGFNQDGDISGRPVDIAQGPDGAIYISDDYAGAIYRVRYGGAATAPIIPAAMANRLDVQPPAWLAEADLPGMALRGAKLYRGLNCRRCHEEGANPKRLDDLSERLGYTAVIETLAAPPSPMPRFQLSDTMLRELAVFLLADDTGLQAGQ